jgi:hypothetical protein
MDGAPSPSRSAGCGTQASPAHTQALKIQITFATMLRDNIVASRTANQPLLVEIDL